VFIAERLDCAPAMQRAGILSLLAVPSAFLSYYVARDPWDVFYIGGRPLLPGVYFALVLSIGALAWATKSKFEVLTVFLLTVLAWFLAVEATHTFGLALSSLNYPEKNYLFALSGMVGGLVGASITVYGVSLAQQQFRNVQDWIRTIAIGGIAGVFLELESQHSLLPLFLVWQPSVAASIGYGLRAGEKS
jgi:hypothetical protein